MFSDYNEIKLKVINRKITGKSSTIWKIYNTLINNLCLKRQSQGKLENILNSKKMKIQHSKNYRI